MTLEQRQVLVGRGVEDHLEVELCKQLLDSFAVPDVSDDQLVAVQESLTVELHLKPVKVGLVVIEHVQRGRPECLDLAAQLAAD